VGRQLQFDTLEDFVQSLGITGPVTTSSSALQAASRPPRALLSSLVRLLGVGRVLPPKVFDFFVGVVDVPPDLVGTVLSGIRSLDAWPTAWMEEAERQTEVAEGYEKTGNLSAAWETWRAVLACQRAATFTDGTHLPIPTLDERWRIYQRLRTTYRRISMLEGRPFHELKIPGPTEKIPAIFHLPGESADGAPTIVLIHGLSGYKEYKDHQGLVLRDAGFATLSIDMPAHGERLFDSRLCPDSKADCVAALDWLSAQPEADPKRLALLGGSMGGYWVLCTAAADPRVRASVALAAPYALGKSTTAREASPPETEDAPRKRGSVPYFTLEFARATGKTVPEELRSLAQQFTLEGKAAAIRCPLFLGHGTQDAIVPFSELWRLVKEVRTEDLTVHPYPGAGHEVAGPGADHMPPILDWLDERLR